MVATSNSQSAMISNDLYSFNTSSYQYSKMLLPPDSRKPRSRVSHAAAVVQNWFVVMGGKSDYGDFRSDLWVYSMSI